eukprot:TRINITY_DN73238_c0_g1_i1.p1 TRINITY_DN73238_c0_g1~~TRINITY_DN73238_c0_g1_i1.p1  ORF type:complete len:246 (+),score=67.48 TRINITY_DN73238_c0_g1_i1:39-740(+)
MGGDGGTIANNRRFLPQAGFGQSRKVKDKAVVDRERWSTCHLTKMPLRPPLMADRIGQLYCAEYVMSALAKKEPVAPYVRGLRDLVTLKPEVAAGKEDLHEALQGGTDSLVSEDCLNLYVCPVTQQTTNGTNKFCCTWACGHVFSQKALKQMGDTACPVCGEETSPSPTGEPAFVRLVPDMDDVDDLVEAQVARHLAALEEKKNRKKKKRGAEGQAPLQEDPESSRSEKRARG